jgi:hypothetical protein
MKSVIIRQFDYINSAEKYANEMAEKGYRLVSFSSYKDLRGLVFVLAKFEQVQS